MKEDYIMNTKVFNFGKVIKISVVILFLIVVFGIFKEVMFYERRT